MSFLMTRTNSRNPVHEFRREMDRLFDDFWTPAPADDNAPVAAEWVPACDVEEKSDYYLMTLEMPGIPKDQIRIECVNNQLTVSGERNREVRSDGSSAWYSERQFGKFSRTFTLPTGVNTEKVEAGYEDGVLRLYIPKNEAAKPRQIKISSGGGAGFLSRLLKQQEPGVEARRE